MYPDIVAYQLYGTDNIVLPENNFASLVSSMLYKTGGDECNEAMLCPGHLPTSRDVGHVSQKGVSHFLLIKIGQHVASAGETFVRSNPGVPIHELCL